VLLERIEPLFPEWPVDRDPIVNDLERPWLEPVEPLSADLLHDDKADLSEQSQVLGD
jgi:hypothetical protein